MRPALLRASTLPIIRALGLTSGLKLCLDAGDDASYANGQSWLDLSGNNHDFFRGADGSATAADPTFNGGAGARTSAEHFSFDGGDYFTYDATNEAWMQNIHKDNAKFTALMWVYFGAAGSTAGLIGTATQTTETGFFFQRTSSNILQFAVFTGSGLARSIGSVASISPASWHLIGVSVDEAANSAFTIINGAHDASAASYTAPASGSSSFTMNIGARGNGSLPLPNGSRIASVAMWEGVALVAAQVRAYHHLTRGRFNV